MTEFLLSGGLLAAVLWIAEIVRGIAYDKGHHVHLIVAAIGLVLAASLWFGLPWIAAASDPTLRPIIGFAIVSVSGAALLLAAIELVRWFRDKDPAGE